MLLMKTISFLLLKIRKCIIYEVVIFLRNLIVALQAVENKA